MHPKRFIRILALLMVGLLTIAGLSAQSGQRGAAVGKSFSIKSSLLQEERSFRVFVPPNYKSQDESQVRLPVLYLLDGQYDDAHVSSLVSHLAQIGRIPEMIVVAIDTPKRVRDLTPTHSLIPYENIGNSDFLSESGGAKTFFQFLLQELIPLIETTFRTAPFRILEGQSLGGLFTADVLLKHPDAFNAYIICSPSLWWDAHVLLKSESQIGRANALVFVSVANEDGDHRESINVFLEMLKAHASAGLKWRFSPYPNETHFSVAHLTTYDGLMFIYSGWDLPALANLHSIVHYPDVAEHYHQLSIRYGYEIPVSENMLIGLAGRLAFQEKPDDGILMLEKATELYPKSALVYDNLAEAYAKRGGHEQALRAWQKAAELKPSDRQTKDAAARAIK